MDRARSAGQWSEPTLSGTFPRPMTEDVSSQSAGFGKTCVASDKNDLDLSVAGPRWVTLGPQAICVTQPGHGSARLDTNSLSQHPAN